MSDPLVLKSLCALQAAVAARDRVAAGEGHREGHGAQEAAGRAAEERGEAPCRDGDAVEDQILRQGGGQGERLLVQDSRTEHTPL